MWYYFKKNYTYLISTKTKLCVTTNKYLDYIICMKNTN